MCGLAGAVLSSSAPVDFSVRLNKGLSEIEHRGPDMRGQFEQGSVWLGHVRLSILDLSSAGAQPMLVENGRFVICYNGEIYNFQEIAKRLGLHGLRSRSDTEVIVRAFAKIGPAIFEQLNGMFALALYDRDVNRVWLARDRFGIKPLYYTIDDQGLFFSSEIKALVAMTGKLKQCDLASLHEWLFYGNTLGANTLYRSVKKLLPGHYLTINTSTFRHEIVKYWSIEDRSLELPAKPGSAVSGNITRLLDQAVKRQLVSDVPVGIFLSGGVDSSAITAFASRHYEGKLATYSAAFDFDKGPNELPKARRVADYYGTEHHEIYISGVDIPDIIEKMVYHHDSPFGDAANIPLYLLATKLCNKTKVVLQGDGGDEVFGGYRRYATLSYRRLLRPLSKLALFINNCSRRSPHYYRRQRYLRALSADDVGTCMALLLTEEDVLSNPLGVFSADIQAELTKYDPFSRYRECQALFRNRDVVTQMSLVDLMVILPDIFLEKVDRSTMAAGIEVRVPFLDHDLVDYALRIPGRCKVPWGRKKGLLKQALKGILPDYVLQGQKTGFGVPYGFWLRTTLRPLFFDHLGRFESCHPDFLNRSLISSWYSEHVTQTRDRSFILWKLLNFLIWANNRKIAFQL